MPVRVHLLRVVSHLAGASKQTIINELTKVAPPAGIERIVDKALSELKCTGKCSQPRIKKILAKRNWKPVKAN